jgi:hypothetical protein
MELFKLRAGVEHLLPDEERDVLPCYELYTTYGGGLADRDLTHVPPMPFRMTGTPVGRTSMLTGVGLFLVMTPRLLHFLESLGDFPHQVIPAHLVPDRDDWRDHPPIDTTSFVVCNLHKHLHIIDFPRCELTPSPRVEGRFRIANIALVEGVTVPPLFRQDDWCLPPLIPRSTYDALIKEGFTDLFLPPLLGESIDPNDIKLPPW